MHPALAQFLAQQQAPKPRPYTPEEQALADHIVYLEGQLIVFERLAAGLDRNHGVSVRADLSPQEIVAFDQQWSADVLDTCLLAGLTSWEIRQALRTGILPDKGSVQLLAHLRTPTS